MTKLVTLLLMLGPALLMAQLSTYKKGKKVGIEYNKEIVVKAKYTEVIIKDDSIATAYKKKKVYYINSNGEIVYKGLKTTTGAFEKGIGISKNKNDYILLINRKGSNLITRNPSMLAPKRQGAYVQLERDLYAETGLIESKVDSTQIFKGFLKVYQTATVTNTKKIRIKLFKKKKIKEYSYYPYFNLYRLNENVKIAEDAISLKAIGNGFLISTADGFSHLYDGNGSLIEHSLSDVQIISENYFTASKDSLLAIYSLGDLQVQVKGNFSSFEIRTGSIWARGKDGSRQAVDIYKGKQLKVAGWNYLRDWDKERSVFRDSVGQFVAWNSGDIISKKYVNFSKPTGYYMLVQDSTSYTWLDVDIFYERSFYYPYLIADVPVREKRPTGFFSIIPNIMHAFFGPKGKDLPTNREIVDAGHQFYEGWAICPTNVKSQSEPFDSAVYIGNVKNLKYNYIDKNNKRLNSKNYSDCFPFINGKAWVKEKGDYYLIDENGNKSGSLHFRSVELDENGLFIVENFGSKGIVDQNYELVVPPRHFRIHRVENKYYDNFTSDKKLLYEIAN